MIPRGLRQLRNARYSGGRWRLSVPDRRVLEDEILPQLAERDDVRRVLDVGCAWFTKWYHRLFPAAEYWTIERYPELAKHGAPHHKAISLLDAGEQFEAGSFDLVICNGVFGWGIDDPAEIEAALGAIAVLLRGDGLLLIGWDDNDEHRPAGLHDALAKQFEPWEFPPRGSAEIRTDTRWRHVFSFYRRQARP